ncbi:MAG TPA: CopD family protein [Alphaproteobacteria bacterium]|nr:CopD family protein [Alphaproteobacteria bacterium]
MSAHSLVPDWGVVARAIHLLAVVVWIGGVWLVTMVLLPGMRKKPPMEWLAQFTAIERRFAPQARVALLLTLLSGLYMLERYDLWDRFAHASFWWMHLMVVLWLIFAVLLLVEPLVLRKTLAERAARDPEATLARMIRLHRILLALALLVIFTAVGGSDGLF